MTERLFVYGPLAPGRPNAHLLAEVPGRWLPATVRGILLPQGWGAAAGYPGIVPDESAADVRGLVFESAVLAQHWARLDDFEGDGYRRVSISAQLADGSRVEAQIYALSHAPST